MDGQPVRHNFAELHSLVNAARPPRFAASLFRLPGKHTAKMNFVSQQGSQGPLG